MKRSATAIGIAMLVLCVFVLFMTGCSKKVVSKDEGVGEKKAAVAEAKPLTDDEAREQALKRDAEAAAAAAAAAAAEAAEIQV